MPARRLGAGGRLIRHPSARIGGVLLLVVVFGAVFAPMLARYDPVAIAPERRLQGASLAHPFGTDLYGRDTLTRVLYGGRISLAVGALSVGLALGVGGTLGALSGFWGGWFDATMMRLSDILLAFPAILLAIGLLAFLGGGFWNVVLAIAIIYTAPMARVARAAVLSVRHEEYVDAASAIGAGDARILRSHILPNAIAPLVVECTLRLALAILAEAALSFLGLGTQPPAPTWGQMIAEGRAVMTFSTWPAIGPGLAITTTVLGFNLLGDGIRDALDPHLHGT
ncbi:MAG: glutathione ABC transporter permease GsiD [Armatimonadetes bacterium RBG_16_67_12]|nr:MAG: glutathione ABC transporter permease GsiD [Armatimonadetes bacterium RBG_16_67_12]